MLQAKNRYKTIHSHNDTTSTKRIIMIHLVYAAWLFAAVGAVVCPVVADVFQTYNPVFPLTPVLLTGLVAHVIAGVLPMLLGLATKPGFGVIQPMRGGLGFVTMQIVGYYCEYVSRTHTNHHIHHNQVYGFCVHNPHNVRLHEKRH